MEQSLREILPGRSANAVSDRKQVANCVAAGIPYFITFDEGILGQKERIEAEYDVQIYTPQEFMLRIDQLLQMERMFFPLKIRELEIPTYIIPIRPYWAGQLFDNVISSENLFGAEPDKLWSIENVYYRHTMPITERAPARILW